MKTIEQERGKILSGRLALLNDFLINEKNTGLTFGEYLTELGLTEREFLAQLPDDLNLPGLASAKAESQNLFGYAKAMNLVYYNQFLKHLDKGGKYHSFDADTEDLSAGVIEEGEEFHDAKGPKKRPLKNLANNIKNEVKKLPVKIKTAVKDPKGAIKNAIDKTKSGIKNTTGKLKDKAKDLGAKIKKQGIIGTANKFNPAFVAMRAAFLGLVVINAFNMAKNFAAVRSDGGSRWVKFVKKFKVMGGSEKILNKEIDKGKIKKKPAARLKDLLSKKKGADGEYHNAVETIAAITGAVVAATPLILMGVNMVKDHKKAKGEALTEDEETGLPEGTVDPEGVLDPETKSATEEIETDNAPDTLAEISFFDTYKIPIFIGGGLLVATVIGLVIRAFVKGKK